MITRDSPDYPGAYKLARELRHKFPHINRRQAYIMACVQIRPDRNSDSKFVGWDQKLRPVFQERDGRFLATMKSGNPTEPTFPITKELPKTATKEDR